MSINVNKSYNFKIDNAKFILITLVVLGYLLEKVMVNNHAKFIYLFISYAGFCHVIRHGEQYKYRC